MNALNDKAIADPWKEVVAHFRSLCFFKLQGKSDVSDNILRQLLPKKNAEWSISAAHDADEKRIRLEEMFQTEQRRVDDAFTLHELSAMQWREELIPSISSQISREIRQTISEQFALQTSRQTTASPEVNFRPASVSAPRKPRIAFDDIPGIIDLIVAEDRKNKEDFAA